MANDVVQVQYESLSAVAKRFKQQAVVIEDQRSQVTRRMETLAAGGWQGRGAGAFFGEMRQTFLPALKRLADALEQGGAVTDEIGRLMRQAEQEAAQPFRGNGGGAPVSLGGSAATAAVALRCSDSMMITPARNSRTLISIPS